MIRQLSSEVVTSRLAVVPGASRRPHLHHWGFLLSTSCHHRAHHYHLLCKASFTKHKGPPSLYISAVSRGTPTLPAIMVSHRASTALTTSGTSNGLPEEVVTCLQNARFVSLSPLTTLMLSAYSSTTAKLLLSFLTDNGRSSLHIDHSLPCCVHSFEYLSIFAFLIMTAPSCNMLEQHPSCVVDELYVSSQHTIFTEPYYHHDNAIFIS